MSGRHADPAHDPTIAAGPPVQTKSFNRLLVGYGDSDVPVVPAGGVEEGFVHATIGAAVVEAGRAAGVEDTAGVAGHGGAQGPVVPAGGVHEQFVLVAVLTAVVHPHGAVLQHRDRGTRRPGATHVVVVPASRVQ